MMGGRMRLPRRRIGMGERRRRIRMRGLRVGGVEVEAEAEGAREGVEGVGMWRGRLVMRIRLLRRGGRRRIRGAERITIDGIRGHERWREGGLLGR